MDLNFGVTLFNPLQLPQLEEPVPTASLCFKHQTQQTVISSRGPSSLSSLLNKKGKRFIEHTGGSYWEK